jgi:hypothetical protein
MGVRDTPPLRVRLGYLYTAGTASSVSWRVTHTHTHGLRVTHTHARLTRVRGYILRAFEWRRALRVERVLHVLYPYGLDARVLKTHPLS